MGDGPVRRRRSVVKEIFLSHSSQDRAFATVLAELLRAHGPPVWYSRTNIAGAEKWHDEIGRALDRGDWFLVVLYKKSVQSKWVKSELMYALQNEQYDNHFVPVVL